MPSLQRAARHHQSIRTEGNATITTTSASGLATNAEGGYLAGMGIAYGDPDGDSRFDLAVTNFYGQMDKQHHPLQ